MQGVQLLYHHALEGKPWEGPEVRCDTVSYRPLVHEILERIGVVGGDVGYGGPLLVAENRFKIEAREGSKETEGERCIEVQPQTPSLASCESATSPVCHHPADLWIPQPSSDDAIGEFWVPVMDEDAGLGRYPNNQLFLTQPIKTEELLYF